MEVPSRIEAPVMGGQVSQNSFEASSGPQLAIDAHETQLTQNSFEGHGAAACLQILGSQGGLDPSFDAQVRDNRFHACNPYGVEVGRDVNAIRVNYNEFPGSYDGVTTDDAVPWDVTGRVTVDHNRIVGTTHLGVRNSVAGTLDANWNWWGCNAGAGAQGCDGASAGVDAGYTATIGALIGPLEPETGIIKLPTGYWIALNPGEKAELFAVQVADGTVGTAVPDEGVEIGFSSPWGTLSRATGEFSNGRLRTVFTAGPTPGHGWIAVTMDNERLLVPVTILGDASGASPPPPAATPAVAPPPPAPRIFVPDGRVLPGGRRVTVGRVTCPTACRVRARRASVRIGRRRYRARVRFTRRLSGESTAPIQVLLRGRAFRALKKHRTVRIRATVFVTDEVGQTTRRTIRVRARR